jgi:hypothetical protein
MHQALIDSFVEGLSIAALVAATMLGCYVALYALHHLRGVLFKAK